MSLSPGEAWGAEQPGLVAYWLDILLSEAREGRVRSERGPSRVRGTEGSLDRHGVFTKRKS